MYFKLNFYVQKKNLEIVIQGNRKIALISEIKYYNIAFHSYNACADKINDSIKIALG